MRVIISPGRRTIETLNNNKDLREISYRIVLSMSTICRQFKYSKLT